MFSNIFKLKCPDCGKNFSDSDNICPNCGIDLDAPLSEHEIKQKTQSDFDEAQKAFQNGRKMSKKRWEVVDVICGVALPDILCGLLIAQGIPAITSREGYGKAKGLHYGPAGETEILVPSDYVNQAHEVIELFYAGAFEEVSDTDDFQ
jgi:hypothetical protein